MSFSLESYLSPKTKPVEVDDGIIQSASEAGIWNTHHCITAALTVERDVLESTLAILDSVDPVTCTPEQWAVLNERIDLAMPGNTMQVTADNYAVVHQQITMGIVDKVKEIGRSIVDSIAKFMMPLIYNQKQLQKIRQVIANLDPGLDIGQYEPKLRDLLAVNDKTDKQSIVSVMTAFMETAKDLDTVLAECYATSNTQNSDSLVELVAKKEIGFILDTGRNKGNQLLSWEPVKKMNTKYVLGYGVAGNRLGYVPRVDKTQSRSIDAMSLSDIDTIASQIIDLITFIDDDFQGLPKLTRAVQSFLRDVPGQGSIFVTARAEIELDNCRVLFNFLNSWITSYTEAVVQYFSELVKVYQSEQNKAI